jgi:phosphoenolpyruvate carboxykinase (ATP)
MAPSIVPELRAAGPVHLNPAPARLVEMALQRQEAVLAASGAIVAYTQPYTGRAARDKYVVVEPGSKDQVSFGDVNQPMAADVFERIAARTQKHLEEREQFIFEGYACAEPRQRLPVRVVAEKAWHALFAGWIFRRCAVGQAAGLPNAGQSSAETDNATGRRAPRGVTIWHAPSLQLDPAESGTRSGAAVILNLERGWIVIAGTHYAGEIKKSIFSYLNYQLPQVGVLPMHCSATLGPAGDVALLFGLSGTGKTTLSADPERRLIGDDEHGWSDEGVFNFEGGCYAKVIRLSKESEPQIYNALGFGSILENVILDPQTRAADYGDASITENTRGAYPLESIPGAEPSGCGGHPSNIFFLACDAFGVLPPLCKLTPEQAMYHFLSGYTAKIGGTEAGIKEPQATFSACFSAPFLTLPPMRYAELLRAKLETHQVPVWLVNTGWTGGPYGQGQRFPLAVTRRLIHAVLGGELTNTAFAPDPAFGLLVPRACPGVPDHLLQPRSTWQSAADYDRQAKRLAELFKKNFAKHFGAAPAGVRDAGPK